MRNMIILLVSTMIFSSLSAQDFNIPSRFVDNYYFRSRDIQVDKSIIYGQAKDFKGKIETLDMDLYYPSASVDSLTKRPMILLVHGGSKGDNSKMEKYCPLFAQRGFVVCNINRRKGRKNNKESESYKEAYRSLQDAHAALRYIVYEAQKYCIDTSAIFVGGVSAGSLTAIGLSFMDQMNFDTYYPTITKTLGRIDESTNEINTKFTIRGVIDMWGQIPDTSFISREEALDIPLIVFHSTADSSLSNYQKALQLSSRYKNLGGCYQLHTSTGTGHVEGISKYYIAEQTGCFLKGILLNSCQSFEIEVDNENINCLNEMPIDSAIHQRSHIKLDSSIIHQYSGKYKTKGEKIIIVTEKGHIFLTDEQNELNEELYPESENDFYLKDDNVQFAFSKNIKGRVSGLTIFIDAKEINFKKIK